MISLEKGMMLTPLEKLPSNVGDLGKIIVATGFEWLPKVQKIAQSGHTLAPYLLVHATGYSIKVISHNSVFILFR